MAKALRKTNPTPFGALSARRRRDAFINLRWRIRRDAPTYGGLFTSRHLLEKPEFPDRVPHWMDLRFLGLDGRTIWSAEIHTAEMAFEDAVEALAWNRAEALLTKEEFRGAFRSEMELVFQKGAKLWRVKPREPRRHPALGGLTFREFEEQAKAEIRAQEPPVIHERFVSDRDYADGFWLSIILDAPRIDQAAVAQAILRFRALGEQDWRSPDPVPLERLLGESGRAVS